MALDFAGSTHQVDHGSGASLDNVSDLLTTMWIWIDSFPAGNNRLWHKIAAGDTTHSFNWTNTPRLELIFARATTAMRVLADDDQFAHYGTGKWMFVAGQSNATTNGSNRLWIGDLSNAPAEPAAYVVQTAGSGTINDDSAGSLIVGVASGGFAPFDGRIATLVWISPAPTNILDALYKLWRNRPGQLANRLLDVQYGYNGTGTQTDYSGQGNHGTVTGATVISHVPIPFRRSQGLWVPKAAAAPAGDAVPQVWAQYRARRVA